MKYLEEMATYLDVSIGELFREEASFSFDIPRREPTQEEWLRGLAKSLGYTIRRLKAED